MDDTEKVVQKVWDGPNGHVAEVTILLLSVITTRFLKTFRISTSIFNKYSLVLIRVETHFDSLLNR